jgi:hypothetical protein
MLLFAHTGIALAGGRFFKNVDLLFLAIGSMLPDIIDKPLGWMIYGTPNMGRIFAHTLLFLLILAALAGYSKKAKVFSLALGVFIHLILDFMWFSPVILLWPLLGDFPPAHYADPLSYVEMLLGALRKPIILIPECLGLAYLIYFAAERKPNIEEYYRRLVSGFHRQCHRIKALVKNF